MKTIFIGNQKGGVGKTTITVNLAHILNALYELKVIVIDNDKQGNTTKFFSAKQEGQATITDILDNVEQDVHEAIQKTRFDGIDIIAGDSALPSAIQKVMNEKESCQYDRYKNALDKIKDKYDICLIDSPPDTNIGVFNALVAANEVIVIATPDEYAVQGIQEMQGYIDIARQYNKNLLFRGCLLNQFTKTPHGFKIRGQIKQNYPVFNTSIRYTKERLNIKVPILELSPTCGFALDLKKFVKELIGIK